jgi:hypothetical protein
VEGVVVGAADGWPPVAPESVAGAAEDWLVGAAEGWLGSAAEAWLVGVVPASVGVGLELEAGAVPDAAAGGLAAVAVVLGWVAGGVVVGWLVADVVAGSVGAAVVGGGALVDGWPLDEACLVDAAGAAGCEPPEPPAGLELRGAAGLAWAVTSAAWPVADGVAAEATTGSAAGAAGAGVGTAATTGAAGITGGGGATLVTMGAAARAAAKALAALWAGDVFLVGIAAGAE